MRLAVIGTGRIGTAHARTLRDLDAVDEVLLTDVDTERARALADELGVRAVDTVEAVYESAVDGVVIAAATEAHPKLIHQGLDHGIAVFCEKPVAADVSGTREVALRAEEVRAPLQIGFQRRFDPGYRHAREALRSGRLGWLHSVRAVTGDPEPPPPAYVPGSGGLFRDCGIHDLDILRWVTGREVVAAQATGANRGAEVFAEHGDVDTGAALLELDDGTLATVGATRYNGAGYDVRMEVCGSDSSLFVGHDERAPLRSAEPGVEWPTGSPYRTFLERFAAAYRAEIEHFVEVVAGRADNPCTATEALEALYLAEACELSRREQRRVTLAEVRR